MPRFNPVRARERHGEYKEGTVVEHLGGARVRFTCPHGHATTVDYSKGPKPRRMSAAATRMMVRYWQQRVTHVCKRCAEEEQNGKA